MTFGDSCLETIWLEPGNQLIKIIFYLAISNWSNISTNNFPKSDLGAITDMQHINDGIIIDT